MWDCLELSASCCYYARAKALDTSGENTLLALSVPLFNPCIRADRLVDSLEILTDLSAFSFDFLATVEVKVALVAVASLVCVGESWIERSGFHLVDGLNLFWCHLRSLVLLGFTV